MTKPKVHKAKCTDPIIQSKLCKTNCTNQNWVKEITQITHKKLYKSNCAGAYCNLASKQQ